MLGLPTDRTDKAQLAPIARVTTRPRVPLRSGEVRPPSSLPQSSCG